MKAAILFAAALLMAGPAFAQDAQTAPAAAPATYPASADLIAEINAARTDPQAYAAHLRAYRAQFEGEVVNRPGRGAIRPLEGVASVDEAIAFLEAQTPMPAFAPDANLDRAAADHVADQGPAGLASHVGSDGRDATGRAQAYGAYSGVAENMSFGEPTARDVVIQFLVDAGVPSRGHRANLFGAYVTVGAACGAHVRYGQMCVVDMGL